MPTEKSEDLKLIDEILSGDPAICRTTPEGMEQLTDSDSRRLLRLARLGALVEMAVHDRPLEDGSLVEYGELHLRREWAQVKGREDEYGAQLNDCYQEWHKGRSITEAIAFALGLEGEL